MSGKKRRANRKKTTAKRPALSRKAPSRKAVARRKTKATKKRAPKAEKASKSRPKRRRAQPQAQSSWAPREEIAARALEPPAPVDVVEVTSVEVVAVRTPTALEGTEID